MYLCRQIEQKLNLTMEVISIERSTYEELLTSFNSFVSQMKAMAGRGTDKRLGEWLDRSNLFACLSKNVPFWRSVCNVLGLMFSIWHTSWLSSHSPSRLPVPLSAIALICVTKLLKFVSSSSQVLRSIDITSMSYLVFVICGQRYIMISREAHSENSLL